MIEGFGIAADRWWTSPEFLKPVSYPVDRGAPSGVRKAKRAKIKRKNKGRAKRG